jgi:fatty-acyl-CoA synthase
MTSFAIASLIGEVRRRVPGERPAIVFDERVTTWSAFVDRAERFAGALRESGVGPRPIEEELDSGHDHVALFLQNGPAYLEAVVGASIAGAATFGVNTRLASAEVAEVLGRLDASVLLFSGSLSATVAEALARLPKKLTLIQDGVTSGGALLPGAAPYEQVLEETSPQSIDVSRDLDQQRVLVTTGGTTGIPKAVLWQSDHFFFTSLRGHELLLAPDEADVAVAHALEAQPPRSLCPTPLVHFASHATALAALVRGGTALVMSTERPFSATDFASIAECFAATDGLIIGDVTGRPVAAAIAAQGRCLTDLRILVAGSTLLSETTKARLIELLPHLEIRDSMGSSETGMQAVAVSNASGIDQHFGLLPGNTVLDHAGSPTPVGDRGMLCRTEFRSIGYFRAREAMAGTYGTGSVGAFVASGDSVIHSEQGRVSLLGRGNSTVNTGGEKVFSQEVESALFRISGVADCLVVGCPSDRWGEEVRALLVWEDEARTESEVQGTLRSMLSSVKVPKRVVSVEAVPRMPSGKADYPAARRLAGS